MDGNTRPHFEYAARYEAELNDRQREVLRLVASGRTNAEIGEELGLTFTGAKWNVSEILTKLGLETREEAAAFYQWRHSRSTRLARRLAPVLSFGPLKTALLASTVAGLTILGITVAVIAHGDAPRTDAIPSAEDSITSVAFRVCGSSPWRRPPTIEMASVFTNRRFGDGLRPYPYLYWLYLSNVYRIVPHAISANVETVALSGIQMQSTAATGASPPGSSACDERFRQDYSLLYDELMFMDHRPLTMTRSGDTLTVTLAPDPGRQYDVILPDPPGTQPAPPDKNAPGTGITTVRAVDVRGQLLYESSAGGVVQYADNGALVFASFGAAPGARPTFTIGNMPMEIVVYAAASRAGSSVVITNEAGDAVAAGPAGTPPAGWIELVRTTLAPGRHTLVASGFDVGLGGGVLILPASAPLP